MSALRLAFQAYTIRDAMSQDYFGSLARVRDGGIDAVEIAGFGSNTAAEVREGLDKIGMEAVGLHTVLNMDGSGVDQLIADAKTLGCHYIVSAWCSEETIALGWETIRDRMLKIGAEIAGKGLQLLHHNHAFEFDRDATGRPGLDTLLGDPHQTLLQAELDVFWVAKAGEDPIAWIEKFHARLPLVHYKDISGDAEKKDLPPGQGTLDWAAIDKACGKAGAEFAIIEMDNYDGDPIEGVLSAARYLETI